MSGEDLTALGTIALAVITFVYVLLTHRISRAARTSAEEARRAAEAMEAQISVSFCAAPDKIKGYTAWAVRNTGGTVWLHGVEAYRANVIDGNGQDQTETRPMHLAQYQQVAGQPWPVRLHRGESTGALWPNREHVTAAHLRVIYSIRRDGEQEGCFCQMQTPDDFKQDDPFGRDARAAEAN